MTLRECVNNFKSLLYAEVKKYNKDKEEKNNLITKLKILEEMIDIMYDNNLASIDFEKINENKMTLGLLLPIIFGNEEANRMYDIILDAIYNSDNRVKINLLAKKLLSEHEKLKKQVLLLNAELKGKVNDIIGYKRILSNYKYNGIITPEQIELIEKVMEKYSFSIENQIRILESVRIHNIKNMYDDPKVSYTVVNMLDTTFEKYDIEGYEEQDKKERFSKTIDSFYESTKSSSSIDDVLLLMPNLEDKTYTFDEFCYIYESMINKIIDDLNEGIQSITAPDIYKDQDLRKVVIQEYNENKFIYDMLQKNYRIKKERYLERLNTQKENSIKEEPTSEIYKNVLFYEISSNNEVTYLERDLKKFPHEYLTRVVELLEKKKKDTLKPDEIKIFNSVNNVLKGYEELRDDQVRIVCKHLQENYYCVIGAFVKKDDNPLNLFYNIVKRGCKTDISTSTLLVENMNKSVQSEKVIYDFVQENARKGSR